jgi:glutamyl-Q tRNA(Asp) synthetase
LVAAVGSFLDARAHGGEWLVRIEDLDPPRERPGAADDILRTLDRLGMQWDGTVVRQSQRSDQYLAALEKLLGLGLIRRCACSRSALAALPINRQRDDGDELFHPPECLPVSGQPAPGEALRLHVPPGVVEFEDRSLGIQRADVASTAGDFVLRRRDGYFAYQLAVVVDDAAQGVTDVVRGADLLSSTPRQILLQRALGLPLPGYLHLPLAVDGRGLKLSKSESAPAARAESPAASIVGVLEFLGQDPPVELAQAGLAEVWRWGVSHWRPERFAGVATRPCPGLDARGAAEGPST